MIHDNWSKFSRVQDILSELVREHDREGITGIGSADLARYTSRILSAASDDRVVEEDVDV